MNLNLPAADLRFTRRTSDGAPMVWDRLRKKFVVLTPEEWVRQHFVEYLIHSKGFDPGAMANEIGLTQNGRKRRCDTVVFDRFSHPLMIVEYKAPEIRLSQDVFDQIVRYNMVLRAPYLVVSNGLSHYCCRVDIESRTVTYLADIPAFSDIFDPLRQ